MKPEMSNREMASAYLKAAEVMETGGWVAGDRGPMDQVDAPHCVLGALQCARQQRMENDNPLVAWLSKFVVNEIPRAGVKDNWNGFATRDSNPALILAAWSNMIAVNARTVAAKLRAAAAAVREA